MAIIMESKNILVYLMLCENTLSIFSLFCCPFFFYMQESLDTLLQSYLLGPFQPASLPLERI